MKKALAYSFGMIALYLVVKNGKGFSDAAVGLGRAGGTFVTRLQGR